MPSIRQIIEVGDPILRQIAVQVKRFDKSLHNLLDDMIFTLENLEGVGLAAPQIGVSKRVFIVDVGNGVTEFINPIITKTKDLEVDTEACFSVPGRHGLVERHKEVEITAQDRYGIEFTLKGKGLFARAIQHELDHLDGKLFIDIMLKEEFD
ncbi:MAG: peptide deformylase [Bacillota bacterium]|jgi:peptide deformylase